MTDSDLYQLVWRRYEVIRKIGLWAAVQYASAQLGREVMADELAAVVGAVTLERQQPPPSQCADLWREHDRTRPVLDKRAAMVLAMGDE